MKKYQLWLERKSYSQHLINLIKIKTSVHTPQHVERKHRKIVTNASKSAALRLRQSEDLQQRNLRQSTQNGDISYPLLNKQVKLRKHQLMRSFEIQQQNENMARRMREVKSVLNFHRHSSTPSEYSRRKNHEKKYEQTNEELRQSKFRKYIKWHKSNVSSLRRYYLSIEIINLSKHIRIHDDFAGVWCEIKTEKGMVRSQLSQLSNLGGYRYGFPLENDLRDKFTLKLYTCKGIQSEKMGQFDIPRPIIGMSDTKWYRSTDNRFEAELKISYRKMLKNKACIMFK